MELKIKKLNKDAVYSYVPTKTYFNDAGFDLYSLEDATLHTCLPRLISTGIALEIPQGYFGSIRDRSGLGSEGVHVLAGVIDSSYRGEVKVALVLVHSDIYWDENKLAGPLCASRQYHIKKGDRIAQLIIQPCALPDVIEVEELTPTDRNTQGWGSSGR